MIELIKELKPTNCKEVILRIIGIYALIFSIGILLNIASLNKIGQLGATALATMIGILGKCDN